MQHHSLIRVKYYYLKNKSFRRGKLGRRKNNFRPHSKWRIEGHTDIIGGYEYNKKLSLLRAEAVYNYFISKELSGDKFEIAGRCEDFPIAGNYTQAGR